jgi:predicted nucleic acid-binding protein
VQFVDTIVLLYAISSDPAERVQGPTGKRDPLHTRSRYVRSGAAVVLCTGDACRRPYAISHSQAVRLIESFRRFSVQDMTAGVMMAALAARERFQLSYWDAAIIEAARAMGCDSVLSEDLNDGQDYAGVRVTDPLSGVSAGVGDRSGQVLPCWCLIAVELSHRWSPPRSYLAGFGSPSCGRGTAP